MRFKRHGDQEPAHLDMTSMLDVVFIMLIFFVLITNFSHLQELEIERAQTHAGQAAESDQLTLTIDREGLLYLQEKPIDLQNLGRTLHRYPNWHTVLIDADTHTPHGLVISAIDQLKAAGVTTIALAGEAVQ